MPTEKPYLYIQSPETEEAGGYLLIVSRPSFGLPTGTPVMIKVHYLKHFGSGESSWIEGWVTQEKDGVISHEKVVEFPGLSQYLLLLMQKVQFLSPEEAASREKELERKISDAMDGVNLSRGAEEFQSNAKHTGVYL